MRHLKIITIAFTLALTVLMSGSISVYATDSVEKNDKTIEDVAVSARSNQFYSGINVYSNTWTTIANSTTGLNCNVYVKSMNTTLDGLRVVGTNIRMLGRNGNVLWSESEAVPGQGSRVFWCGSNIYKIQAQPKAGVGVIYCRQN